MNIKLPGRCIVCLAEVYWNGHYWRRPGKGGAKHRCSEDRPVCGVWMPIARQPCARLPGHGYEHKTAYALSNDRRMRSGVFG